MPKFLAVIFASRNVFANVEVDAEDLGIAKIAIREQIASRRAEFDWEDGNIIEESIELEDLKETPDQEPEDELSDLPVIAIEVSGGCVTRVHGNQKVKVKAIDRDLWGDGDGPDTDDIEIKYLKEIGILATDGTVNREKFPEAVW